MEIYRFEDRASEPDRIVVKWFTTREEAMCEGGRVNYRAQQAGVNADWDVVDVEVEPGKKALLRFLNEWCDADVKEA